MPKRDRAAVHVHLLLVETELTDDGEALRGERFVQLDEVDLLDPDAGSLEQLPYGRDRADAHHARIDTGDGAADERAEGLHAQLLSLLLARDHECRGAVIDAARVARRDASPVRTEGRSQRGQLLRARLGTRMLVALDPVHRDELVAESPGFVGGGPALLRAQAECVLILARHVPA